MNCREALEQFYDHVQGQLSPFEKWRLRLHLWICGHCRKYLRSYRTTIAAEQAAFSGAAEMPPTKIPDGMVASIPAAAKISPKKVDPNGKSSPRHSDGG